MAASAPAPVLPRPPPAAADCASSASADAGAVLDSWSSSPSRGLLLDLRRTSSHRARRLRPSTLIPYTQLEWSWFQLPAFVVPFAILLPSQEEGEEMLREMRASEAATASLPKRNDRDKDKPAQRQQQQQQADASSAHAASSPAPPAAPSSPSFVYSPSALLGLLRFYGWRPDWVLSDSDEALWSSASERGIVGTEESHPLELEVPHVLFAPAKSLADHFEQIQDALRARDDAASTGISASANGCAAAAVEPEDAQQSSKHARLDSALCVSSASSSASASWSPADAASSPSWDCLDVACGSGRDVVWVLMQSMRPGASVASSSPAPRWNVTGVDLSCSALERARFLAGNLGVADRLTVCQARINQSNGEWKVGEAGGKAASGEAVPAAAAAAAAPIEGASTAASPAPASLNPSQQRREKRKAKDAARASAALKASASAPPFLSRQYDLILMIRFLSRVFLKQQLAPLLKPGGFALISTFIDDEDASLLEGAPSLPANAEFRIRGRAEMAQIAAQAGLEVVCNEVGRCEDGRPISDCLFRKPC